jgi:hypothetical protein
LRELLDNHCIAGCRRDFGACGSNGRSGKHDGARKGQAGPNVGETWIRTTLPRRSVRSSLPSTFEMRRNLNSPAIRFEYKSGLLKITNNGYTAVRVNYAPGIRNFLFLGDPCYELTQFHFHHPSEESTQGKPLDMVAHLMHESSDGKTAGVAVLLKAGGANSNRSPALGTYAPNPGQRGGDRGRRGQSCRPAAPRHLLVHLHGVARGSALH